MVDTCGKVMFKLFEPMSPPPGWKCPKRFKLGLGEPWKSKGSNDSDTDTDKLVLCKETTEMCKNHAKMGTNSNGETETK